MLVAITLVIMNGPASKLFENIINDVQNKGNGEIDTAEQVISHFGFEGWIEKYMDSQIRPSGYCLASLGEPDDV